MCEKGKNDSREGKVDKLRTERVEGENEKKSRK